MNGKERKLIKEEYRDTQGTAREEVKADVENHGC